MFRNSLNSIIKHIARCQHKSFSRTIQSLSTNGSSKDSNKCNKDYRFLMRL